MKYINKCCILGNITSNNTATDKWCFPVRGK